MATPEPGLREKILSTAKSLFILHGYHGLAMRQISEALNVSKPALYYHFKDKEELFLAILKAYLDEMEGALNQIAAKPVTCREKIRLFVAYVLVQPPGQRAIIRLASQEMGQLSDLARKPEVATWALLGMMYPYFYPTHAGNAGLSDEIVELIVTLYLEGISNH
jgi:AcrR family transcriptional regulator